MNPDNHFQGANLTRHPLADEFEAANPPVYAKEATVIAVQADNPGIIDTPEGKMTFQAGDWILTDNPPTHAWPIRQLVFESTYARVGAGYGPKIVDQDVSTISAVEGLTKGRDERGFPPQGQPPVPGYAKEARDAARRSAAAAERHQQITAPRSSRSAPKASPAKAAPAK